MRRSRLQTGLYLVGIVCLILSSVVGAFLLAYFVSLRWSNFDAQWELPFPVYGIPAVLLALAGVALLRLSGLRRNLRLMAWVASALLVPILLNALIWYGLYPHAPTQACCN